MHRITCAANYLRVRLLTPIVLTLSLCCSGLAANDKTAVKVMTRNMDSGTDLLFIFAATNLPSFVAAIAATYAEINASNIPQRAGRLADEIAARDSDPRCRANRPLADVRV
jgi:hypothetical protein